MKPSLGIRLRVLIVLSVYLKGVLIMATVPFTQVAHMLAVDVKTLRQWLKRESMSLHQSPTDARVKGLTSEQVQRLAHLHGRVLPASSTEEDHKLGEVVSQVPLAPSHNADLPEKLARLEALVVSQQAQIAALSLQLLQQRDQRLEHCLLTLEAFLTSAGVSLLQPQTPSVPSQQDELPEALDPRGQRARLIPLIELSARGSYVIICPKEGELHITPDTPEWFAWLASLSSFRFVGKSGRLSARRGPAPRSHHSWYAQRTIHQQCHCKYIGVSQYVTIALLEQIAASFQSYIL